jgi:hypothetical protein
MMIDGRADLHTHLGDPDSALALLEAARPVLEARGNPFRQHAFYMVRAWQQGLASRLRPDEQTIADLRRSLAAAEQSRDAKDIGYATSFLGWFLWLHGDRDEARERLHASLDIADRVGEVMLHAKALPILAMLALGGHDVAAVRDLTARAIRAAQAHGEEYSPLAQAPLAWLAWQDGRPDDVLRIAAEIESMALGSRADPVPGYRWVYLFPLIATQLSHSDTERAVSAARPLLDSDQHGLPHELDAAVAAACQAWDRGRGEEAAAGLRAALGLARDTGFF